MTWDPTIFATLSMQKGGHIIFGDNSQGKIIGKGNIGGNPSPLIENVFLVDKLKYNLLSISQLYHKGYKINFEKDKWFIADYFNNVIYTGNKITNAYIIDTISSFNDNNFLLAKDNDIKWIWHRKLGHSNFDLISKFFKKNLVIGLPKVNFDKDHICDAYQFGKQIKTSFKSKDFISTNKPLLPEGYLR